MYEFGNGSSWNLMPADVIFSRALTAADDAKTLEIQYAMDDGNNPQYNDTTWNVVTVRAGEWRGAPAVATTQDGRSNSRVPKQSAAWSLAHRGTYSDNNGTRSTVLFAPASTANRLALNCYDAHPRLLAMKVRLIG